MNSQFSPPLPPGFQLDNSAQSEQGQMPSPPPGFEVDAQQSQGQGKPEAWNPGLGLARDVVNGIPVLGPMYTGAVDAVTTRLAGMMTGEDPQAIKDRVYGKQDQYEADHPLLSGTGRMVGGIAAMAPLGATSIGQKAFGLAGPLATRAFMGGISGGAIAGGDTMARGGSLQDAGWNAAGGAALGAAGGAAAPHIGAAMTKVGDYGRKALGMAPRGGNVGISKPASEILTRALNADGTLGTQAGVNMSQAGPRAMFADASRNASGLLDTAVARSGPGSRTAVDAIEARASGSYDDIMKALSDTLGDPKGVYSTSQTLRTGAEEARKAAYKAAYSSAIDYASEAGRKIEQLMPRIPGSVVDAAKKMMQAEGIQSKQMFASIADDGSVIIKRMPDVQELDYITRALNKVANSTEGTGAFGRMDDLGRIYSGLSREIRSATKIAAPAYEKALETAATPLQQKEALEFGARLLSPKIARDEAADILSGMTGPQREYVKQGVSSKIDEVLSNVKAVASDPNIDAREAKKALQDLSSRAAKEKITALIGDEGKANALFKQLSEASKSLELRADTATNSRTFAREVTNNTVNSYVNDGAINNLKDGNVPKAIQSIIQALTGRDTKGKTAIADKVYSELASILTMSPDKGMDLVSGLATRQMSRVPNASGLPGAIPNANQAIVDALIGKSQNRAR